ncbi:hypothetical protein GCM10022198_12220 [Klugiella xanthotipulae]|uniref:CopC domain-containing protein n=1 Tax=Klugiella xanthotipulae TaxID=244735 RepID=A0A543I4A8_9MICO|nr:copper resistance CopC family protein [Klugiella xanthotipulae]TQM65310.1 hypothetical protein FB466_0104 [Klugiella xanthotipulae]
MRFLPREGQGEQRRHRLTRILATTAIALGVMIASQLAPSAASAHDQLISADPADGSELEAMPDSVTLTFSDTLLDIGTVVRVVDATDTAVTRGDLTLSGASVTQPLNTDAPDGTYTVVWRVVSGDGHPITGTFTFVVGEPSAVVAPTTATTAPAEATSGSTETARSIPSAIRTILVVVVGAGVGLGLYVLVIRLRTRRTPK